MKDWTGNNKSIFTCNGASNHSDEERQIDDYYATEPKAVELLLEQETFSPYVWEIACGEGHISEVLKSHGYKVRSTDIVNRGYPDTEVRDFLILPEMKLEMKFPEISLLIHRINVFLTTQSVIQKWDGKRTNN